MRKACWKPKEAKNQASCPPKNQVVNAKEKFLKGIKEADSSEHVNDKKVK